MCVSRVTAVSPSFAMSATSSDGTTAAGSQPLQEKEFDHFKKSSRLSTHNIHWQPSIPPSYITEKGLSTLKQYKYRSGLSGFLDRVIMTPYWELCVTFVPSWVAPNLLTIVSLLCASLAYLLLALYTPGFRGQPPALAYFVAAFLMFMYQTLDAIDGKQARRTGSSSPLGQLFDHGCDAVCAVFHGLFLAATINAGSSLLALLALYFAIVPFFISNWEESATGFMRFGVLGVTEAQFTSMGVLVATGILSSQLWEWHLIGWFSMKHLFVLVGMGGVVFQCATSAIAVISHLSSSREATAFDRRQSIVSIAQFVVYLVLSTIFILVPSSPYAVHPTVCLWLVGLLFAYQASRLIICHVTLDVYPLFFTVLYPLPLLVVAVLWRWYEGDVLAVQWVALYIVFALVLYAHFVYVSINQITHYLGIQTFHIKPRIIQSTSGPVAEPH